MSAPWEEEGDGSGGPSLISRYPFHYSTPPIEAETSFLWTSMNGVLVGPAVTAHGSPTSGVATPFVTHDGTPVTGTYFDGVSDYLTAALADPTGDVTHWVLAIDDVDDKVVAAKVVIGSRTTGDGLLLYPHSDGRIYGAIYGDTLVSPNLTRTFGTAFTAALSVDMDGKTTLITDDASNLMNTPAGNKNGGVGIGIGASPAGQYPFRGVIIAAGVINKALTVAEFRDYQRTILGYAAGTGPQDSTFARASAAMVEEDGEWFVVSKGMPRVNSKGILIEGERTNLAYNTIPSATAVTTGWTATGGTLSIVDDATELAAAGLSNVGDDVFKLVNASGSTQYVYGGAVTGNTNAHSLSVFARSTGTTPRVGWYDAGFTAVGNIGANLARVEYANETPPGAAEQFCIEVVDGATLWFTLPQLEEGAFCSTPIPNVATAATATRNEDVVTLGTAPVQSTFRALSAGTWTETAGSAGTIDLGDEIATSTCDTFEVVV